MTVKKLESDKLGLEYENKKLGVRYCYCYYYFEFINSAAIGFENLTPRGNYIDILKTN